MAALFKILKSPVTASVFQCGYIIHDTWIEWSIVPWYINIWRWWFMEICWRILVKINKTQSCIYIHCEDLKTGNTGHSINWHNVNTGFRRRGYTWNIYMFVIVLEIYIYAFLKTGLNIKDFGSRWEGGQGGTSRLPSVNTRKTDLLCLISRRCCVQGFTAWTQPLVLVQATLGGLGALEYCSHLSFQGTSKWACSPLRLWATHSPAGLAAAGRSRFSVLQFSTVCSANWPPAARPHPGGALVRQLQIFLYWI